MLMVSATGDWTKHTLQVEYPAVRQIYRLFDAEDRVHAVQMNAPHNYNQESREAVYGWFAHWLLGRTETNPIKERGVSVAPLTELLVFYGRPRPAHELTEEGLIAARIAADQLQLREAQPKSLKALAEFRQRFGVAFAQALQASYPQLADLALVQTRQADGVELIELSRKGAGDQVKLEVFPPLKAGVFSTVLLVAAPDKSSNEIIEALRKANHRVIRANVFAGFTNQTELNRIKFFTTYNRTLAANRVQDILTALAYVQRALTPGKERLTLVGLGEAGLWALLARGLAPAIERTIVDVQQFPAESDAAFVQWLPIPGLRRAGDFDTAVTLAPLTPLLIYNTGSEFHPEKLAEIYRRLGNPADFQTRPGTLSTADLIATLQTQ
jgi:hypothetical protein